MAKMLAQRDFNFADIGKRFELDEVIPVYKTEQRTDDKGEVIKGKDGRPQNFSTDQLIGYSYNVTILDGQFRKKSTQIKVLDPNLIMTNEEIMKYDSVQCSFQNLTASMIDNPMYYKADAIMLLEPTKK